MTTPHFATAAAAEKAFYAAFEQGDLTAMDAVWAAGDEVACIHPLGPRLQGAAAVHAGWAGIFAAGERLRFHLNACHATQIGDIAIHVLHEHITWAGDTGSRPPVIATNIYRRTEFGWRMILHHASPAPRSAVPEPARTH